MFYNSISFFYNSYLKLFISFLTALSVVALFNDFNNDVLTGPIRSNSYNIFSYFS